MFAACKKENQTNDVVGTWHVAELEITSEEGSFTMTRQEALQILRSVDDMDEEEVDSIDDVDFELVMKAAFASYFMISVQLTKDGNYTVNIYGEKQEGTYIYEDSKITITIQEDDEDEPTIMELSIEDGKAIYEEVDEENGLTLRFVYEKVK